MARTIKEIMELFLTDPQWGIGKVRKSEPRGYQDFLSRYTLPKDYQELLSITDGFVLYHAGDYHIYDMAWASAVKSNPAYANEDQKDEVLEIGYFMDYYLYIDQKKSASSQYLYAGDSCSTKTVCVGTITDFLNGLIEGTERYGADFLPFPFWETEGKPIYKITK